MGDFGGDYGSDVDVGGDIDLGGGDYRRGDIGVGYDIDVEGDIDLGDDIDFDNSDGGSETDTGDNIELDVGDIGSGDIDFESDLNVLDISDEEQQSDVIGGSSNNSPSEEMDLGAEQGTEAITRSNSNESDTVRGTDSKPSPQAEDAPEQPTDDDRITIHPGGTPEISPPKESEPISIPKDSEKDKPKPPEGWRPGGPEAGG